MWAILRVPAGTSGEGQCLCERLVGHGAISSRGLGAV